VKKIGEKIGEKIVILFFTGILIGEAIILPYLFFDIQIASLIALLTLILGLWLGIKLCIKLATDIENAIKRR